MRCQTRPRRARGALSLLAFTLALAACSEAPPKKDVIATVNGVEITSDQITAEARASGVAITAQGNEVRDALLTRVIDRELLAQKAQRQKLDLDPEYLSARVRNEKNLLAQIALSRVVRPDQNVSDKAVAAYIAANPAAFAKRQMLHIDRIVFAEKDMSASQLEPALTMDSVFRKVDHAIPYDRSDPVVDSATLPPALVAALQNAKGGEPVYFQQGPQLVYLSLLGQTAAVQSAEDQKKVARATLRQKSAAEQTEAETKRLRGNAKIVYQQGFSPAKDKAAAGKKQAAE